MFLVKLKPDKNFYRGITGFALQIREDVWRKGQFINLTKNIRFHCDEPGAVTHSYYFPPDTTLYWNSLGPVKSELELRYSFEIIYLFVQYLQQYEDSK